ncbi:hypothetical protein ACFOD4_15965 [Pseudoroseomonas globiformis]|uniref:DUF2939 domain-containing protein n=2 Tax=Teichococcus globiformis TaxID=2307229 RepID=A0ABV7G4Z9_9PROT
MLPRAALVLLVIGAAMTASGHADPLLAMVRLGAGPEPEALLAQLRWPGDALLPRPSWRPTPVMLAPGASYSALMGTALRQGQTDASALRRVLELRRSPPLLRDGALRPAVLENIGFTGWGRATLRIAFPAGTAGPSPGVPLAVHLELAWQDGAWQVHGLGQPGT